MKMIKAKNRRLSFELIKFSFLAIGLTLFLAEYASATNFTVSPIKLYLAPKTSITKLILTNGDERDCDVQIKVFQWNQDEKGQEAFTETKDIIIYPQIATLKKGEEKIIRIASKLKPGLQEKTYRIFVEEIPSKEKEEVTGSAIRFLLNVGVPLFISPLKKEEKGAVEGFSLQNGKAEVKVSNQGSQHFVIKDVLFRGLDKEGKEIFSKDLSGWYLLSGAAKAYETTLSKDVCTDVKSLKVEVNTDMQKMNLKELLPVQKTMCGQGT
jgi:fimbrial chaperone protein